MASWLSAQEFEALAISETVLLSAGYMEARGQMCGSRVIRLGHELA
jgi:hypothetical protein